MTPEEYFKPTLPYRAYELGVKVFVVLVLTVQFCGWARMIYLGFFQQLVTRWMCHAS